MEQVTLGVVIPAYNEEENIRPMYTRLSKVLDGIAGKWEILFVNDGSTDGTLKEIQAIRQTDKRVKYIDFSRNFGHEMANTAGFRHVNGDAVVIIDADLQDPPEVIADMVGEYKRGHDIVYAKRLTRKRESLLKKWTSKAFYRVLAFFSDTEIPLDTGDFRLLSRPVVNQLNQLNERNRFFRGLTHWVGYKVTYVEYHRDARNAGETKYNYMKLMKLAFDAILSFSYRPLKIFSVLGGTIATFSFLWMLYWIVLKILGHPAVEGWTSLMSIISFFFGILMLQISLIGEYIARIYEEVRNRPLYIVRKQGGIQEENGGAYEYHG